MTQATRLIRTLSAAALVLSTLTVPAYAQNGGSTLTSTPIRGADKSYGALRVTLCDAGTGKPLASSLNARWQLSSNALLRSSGNTLGGLADGKNLEILIRPVPGYRARAAVPVTIRGGVLLTANVCLTKA